MSTPPAEEPKDRQGLIWIGRLLLLLACGLAVYLGIASLRQEKIAGCDAGAGCDLVLKSRWSQVFGLPVALLGAVLYLGYLALDLANRQAALRQAIVLAIFGAALWFVILQAFVVKAFCPWCCATHAAAVLGLIAFEFGRRRLNPAQWNRLAWPAGAVAIVTLILAQAFGPAPATTVAGTLGQGGAQVAPRAASRFIELHEGKFRVEATALPAIGDPAVAEHVVIGLFDYTCPHCRHLHGMLEEARKPFGQRLAIVQLPGSTSARASNIQRLMLAAYKTAPDHFQEVAHLIHADKLPASEAEVRTMLAGLIGEEKLTAALAQHQGWADAQIALAEAIRQANKPIINSTRFPQLIIGKHIEAGERESVGAYFKLFEEHLGLKRGSVPRLAVVPASMDLGKIAASSQQALAFDLANPGSVPVTIDRVQLTPGMKFAKPGPEKLALIPGQTFRLEIEAEAPPVLGPAKAEIAVHSDAETPEVKIPILAEIWSPIRLEPKSIDFGDLNGAAPPAKVQISLEGPAKLGPPTSNLAEFNGALTAGPTPNSYELTVTASPNLSQPGIRRGIISLTVAPEDKSANWAKQITVPVRSRVPPPAQKPAAQPSISVLPHQ